MITTKELKMWKRKIVYIKSDSKKKSKEQGVGVLAYYFIYLVEVSDAQLSLIERLIMQSEENDKKGE